MKAYLRREFSKFSGNDFSPCPEIWNAVTTWLAWTVLAALSVSLTRWRCRFAGAEYFNAAIEEGIGTHLWNVLGCIGIMSFGLFVAKPDAKRLAMAANWVLLNTFAIGSLTMGLLFSKLVNAFIGADFKHLETWGYGVVFVLLFIIVTTLNTSLWYLGYLSMPARLGTGFAETLSRVDLRLRVVFCLLFVSLPVFFLLRES
jgi:hypothetical protein